LQQGEEGGELRGKEKLIRKLDWGKQQLFAQFCKVQRSGGSRDRGRGRTYPLERKRGVIEGEDKNKSGIREKKKGVSDKT